MQNKLHEAQSLPRQYAGYYETLKIPAKYRGSVHYTAFYSTFEFLDCQEKLNKETRKKRPGLEKPLSLTTDSVHGKINPETGGRNDGCFL